mgnify:FL=1
MKNSYLCVWKKVNFRKETIKHHTMKKLLLLILAVMTVQLNAQDLAHYKKIVKELSSAKYQGRGYAEDGAN